MAQKASYPPNPRVVVGDNSGTALDPVKRKVDFIDAIQTWVSDRRDTERMTRRQIANLDSLGRLVAQRQAILDNLAFYYEQNPNADVAPGVLAFVTILSDNSDGCCTVSADRMARFFSRSLRRILEAVSRLEGWDRDPHTALKFRKNSGMIVVERTAGSSSKIYPVVHPSFGSSKDALTWLLDVRAPRATGKKPGRPKNDNTPDASVTPILDTPDTGDEIPLTPVTNTRDAGDIIPLTPASPDTTNSYTTRNNTKGETRLREEPPASPDFLGGSEVAPGSKGADYLWAALEGTGLVQTKGQNYPAMRRAMATCQWIAMLTKTEAKQLASVCANAETFWPKNTALSECAQTYFEKRQRIESDRADYVVALKNYHDYQSRISDACATAEKIAAQFPEVDDGDWNAQDERRKRIKEAQVAAGVDLALTDHMNRRVMLKPSEPMDTASFKWPKPAAKVQRWQS